MINKLLKF